ncbi:hypothetical protein AbraIFM66950_000585 [Aspergillus brasiliensis]|nr:hypothetical protein AbraIFM66950_000585 [Aspergillus brasiliensis]
MGNCISSYWGKWALCIPNNETSARSWSPTGFSVRSLLSQSLSERPSIEPSPTEQPTTEQAVADELPKAPRNLDTLPAEIFDMIAGYLDQNELCSLYLVSQRVNKLTYSSILASLHAKKHTGLTPKEIETIHTLATDPTINHLPRSLHVSVPYIGHSAARRVSWGRLSYSRTALHELPEMKALRQDLNRLVNCKEFHFTLTRARSTLGNKVMYIEDALYAVLAENTVPVERLILDSRVVKSRANEKSMMHPNLVRVWRRLKSLKITESPSLDFSRGTALSHILQHAPELRSLSLHSLADTPVRRSTIFRLASSANIGTNRLEKLRLTYLTVAPEDLIMWLTRFNSTLRILDLHSVGLAHGSWVNVVQHILDSCPNLQKVVVDYPWVSEWNRRAWERFECSGPDIRIKLEQFKQRATEANL